MESQLVETNQELKKCVEPDEKDQEILDAQVIERDKRKGPRVGDFLMFSDGELHRFSHNWGEKGLQTSPYPGGSFYLGDGFMSYSGGLNPCVPLESILNSDEIRLGRAWFFHHGHAMAHNGVDVDVVCRVYNTELKSTHWHR